MLDAETCHAAFESKDRRYDGRFYIGVTSTRIYCRCVCTARKAKRDNRTFWPSPAAAEAAGFRACRICRPTAGAAPVDAAARLAIAARARIAAGVLEEGGLEHLARGLGVSTRHLRRVMKAELGAKPIEVAQVMRLRAARRLLRETAWPVTEIAFASGFRSVRRFNAALKAHYGVSPVELRGARARSKP